MKRKIITSIAKALPPPFRHMYSPHNDKIGSGRFADIFPLESKLVLRLCHMGYNPYNRDKENLKQIQLRRNEYEIWCMQFMSCMKIHCPNFPVPELLDHGTFNDAINVGDKGYFAWQIMTRMPGLMATSFLPRAENTRPFSLSLANALYHFHTVGGEIDEFGVVPEEMGFENSRIHSITSKHHRVSSSEANLALMQTLHSDLKSKYDNYDPEKYVVMHGDANPDNIHVYASGVVTGLFDAMIRRAPLETEFFPLARNAKIMTSIAKDYGFVSHTRIDMDFVHLAASAAQLYFAKLDGPERLVSVAECLEQLGQSTHRNKAFYSQNAKRLLKESQQLSRR